MNFPQDAPVTKAKLDLLKRRIEELAIDLSQVEEKFIKGSGPGGQKINKSSIGVQLSYPPENISVKWARERSRGLNRFLALRELVDEVEIIVSPETSERLKEQEKIRKQKGRRKRRNRNKEN